tara:strand:+ start:1123 stop:1824 length:702 start_codon:yes stop_codon:yes gene_type:complete
MENKETSILIIEDDKDIVEMLSFHLKKNNYTILYSYNGEDGLTKARENNPDLILLDLMLPGIHGLDVCRIIKSDQKTKNIPIIMLTAMGQEDDVVKGLETGGDDYITKPFSLDIISARIKAVLRRSNIKKDELTKSINIHGVIIRPRSREVIIDNKNINLTYTEFQILFLLASHPGWVFTRYQIIDKIRGDSYPVTDRSVDFQIVGLRKKIGKKGKHIMTIRGVGYKFLPDDT